MVTSLQRIIAITIIIDIVMLYAGFVYSTTTPSISEYQAYLDKYKNFTSDYNTQYAKSEPDTETMYLEKQYGDQKAGGQAWYTIFTKGVSLQDQEVETETDQRWMGWGIGMTIIIINALLGFEIFLVLYTKKNS